MHIHHIRKKLFVFVIGISALSASGWAYADPPLRVARLGYIEGQVSFSPAGEPDWVQSVVNRPLTTGDRLWVDARSRAELQMGGSAIRLGENTNVTLLNVDDNITQVQLVQGTLKLHVRRIDANQILEIDTPNFALTVHKAGDYRLDVRPNGDATEVSVISGEAEVYGGGTSYAVRAGQGYRFFGTGLSDFENLTVRLDDDLDRWARERERRIAASISARYVSSELVGYEDLDANGVWSADPTYGYVWAPSRVAVGWTPYHDGHWAWVNPWGWTWVDAAPWGYAVSHYGRWAHIRGAWAWVPGPVRERAVYAPALVVFLGGTHFQGGAVGWFPLAPREVYQPAYRVSHGYFDNINRSNAVIAPTTITNIYNTHITNVTNVTNVTYINRNVTGAVVAMPMHAFAQSQSVARAAMPLPRDVAMNAAVTAVAAVAPVVQSVHGGAPDASAKPPVHEQRIVARTAPPAPLLAFAAQQPQLAARPGAPLDDPRRTQLKPAVPAEPAPQVKLMANTQAPVASALPMPAPVRHDKPMDEHKPEAAKPASVQTIDPPKTAELKADAATRAEVARAATAAAAQTEKVRADAEKAKAAREEAARTNAAKEDAFRAGAARAAAARVQMENNAKQAREEAGKAEAARSAAVRAEADKARSARDDAARAHAAREAAARAQADNSARAAREEAARARMARVEAARPVAAPTPAPAPVHAQAQAPVQHAAKSEHAVKPGEKRDKAEEEAKRH